MHEPGKQYWPSLKREWEAVERAEVCSRAKHPVKYSGRSLSDALFIGFLAGWVAGTLTLILISYL